MWHWLHKIGSTGSLQRGSRFVISSRNFPLCIMLCRNVDRLCGLLIRVPGYRSRGPGFDSRRYQIFWEVVGLERGPLSIVRVIEELFE
jgi:hypothetical protein